MVRQQGLTSEALHLTELTGLTTSESSIRQTEHNLADINLVLTTNATTNATKVRQINLND